MQINQLHIEKVISKQENIKLALPDLQRSPRNTKYIKKSAITDLTYKINKLKIQLDHLQKSQQKPNQKAYDKKVELENKIENLIGQQQAGEQSRILPENEDPAKRERHSKSNRSKI